MATSFFVYIGHNPWVYGATIVDALTGAFRRCELSALIRCLLPLELNLARLCDIVEGPIDDMVTALSLRQEKAQYKNLRETWPLANFGDPYVM